MLRSLLWNARLAGLRRRVQGNVERILARKYAYVSYHSDEAETFDQIRAVKAETGMLIRETEAYQLLTAARAALKIPGAFAEFGVYNGGSAKLLCELKGERPLHLFDSFEGLPSDDEGWQKGWFRGSREAVERLLAPYPHVRIHQGYFPGTGEAVKDESFAFVHLDVDIYQSTLDGLRFFYPRLAPGGILLSHDHAPGSSVARAFEEYFAEKPTPVVPLPPRYAMVVRT